MPRSESSLIDAARSWVGTPFVDNSRVKGRGVCCHFLMAEIYREAGWGDIDVPPGIASAGRWANESPVLQWLRGPGAKHFAEVEMATEIGDLILVKTGHVYNHLAMLLDNGDVIHVTQHGVKILNSSPIFRRVVAIAFRLR